MSSYDLNIHVGGTGSTQGPSSGPAGDNFDELVAKNIKHADPSSNPKEVFKNAQEATQSSLPALKGAANDFTTIHPKGDPELRKAVEHVQMRDAALHLAQSGSKLAK